MISTPPGFRFAKLSGQGCREANVVNAVGLLVLVVETERLRLRRLRLDDASFMLDLLNAPTFIRHIGDRNVRTLEVAREYIENGPIAMYARLGFGFYAVELKATTSAIGFCGFAKRDYLEDVDIGFAFLPQFCGNGYGREAATAVLEYGRTRLGLKRVVATTRLDNQASISLLEKVGLRFERVMMHPDGDRQLNVFAIDFP